MEHFPSDLIQIIFYGIKLITDKRQFMRLCKSINKMTKQLMIEYEKNFTIDNFKKIDKYCVEKFTLELCNDGYYNKIPMSYSTPTNKIIVSALAAFGNVELLKIALNSGCVLVMSNEYTQDMHLHKYDVSNITDTCALAAQNGHIDVIEFCINNGCKLNWISYLMAAKNGQLETLKWLKKKNIGPLNTYVSSIAAYNGHYDVMKWLILNECAINNLTGGSAAENGHLNILKLLIDNGCVMNEWISGRAALYGKLHILIYLKEINFKFTMHTCNHAASNGQLETLILLKNYGCKFYDSTCLTAADNGHLEVLRWLVYGKCEYDKDKICISAAVNGHIPIFEWLIEIKYELNLGFIFGNAKAKGYIHIFEWLIKKFKFELDLYDICNAAITNSYIHVLEWITANGFVWEQPNIDAILKCDKRECVIWAKTKFKIPEEKPREIPKPKVKSRKIHKFKTQLKEKLNL